MQIGNVYIAPGLFIVLALFAAAALLYFLVEKGNRRQLSPRVLRAVQVTSTLLLCATSFFGGMYVYANVFT